MNSTNAAEVIIQPLWPGPEPEILLFTFASVASAPRAALLTYASRSATRCARSGSAFAAGAAGAAGDRETYPAVVEDVADIGTLTTLTVRLRAGQDRAPELRVRTTATVALAPGDRCAVRLPAADITAWAKNWNANPKPYVWTKTADEILESLAIYCQRINDSRH